MTFKNGAYLEYSEEKHRETLINDYGLNFYIVLEKVNEIVTRINEQDEYLMSLKKWGDDILNSVIELRNRLDEFGDDGK